MPTIKRKITPFLWFDTQAEEAAQFYTSIFDNSRIVRVNRYGKAGRETHGKEAGSVMTVEFEIEGQTLVALNGGPHFRFTEAFSLQVNCETQAEIDYFWSKLSEGGQESRCGWLKDKYGLSWQVVPAALPQMLMDADRAKSERAKSERAKSERAIGALLQMKKFDIVALQRAYDRQG
jgi:predicted 3-demethylubiquinone-9 3-methyltransferase (glyoxalase superfamily)